MANLSIQSSQKTALLAAVVVLLVLLGFTSLVIVQPGTRGIILTMGKMSPEVLMPGPHLRIPFVQKIIQMDVRVRKYEETESAASHDLQTVTTQIAVNYAIDPLKVADLYQNVGTEDTMVIKLLTPAISNAVKSITAKYDAEDLVAKRDEVRGQIEKEVTQALQQYGILIRAVNITNFKFTQDYAQAIERKQVAQQRALQAKYELQQTQIEAQKQVVQAKAAAEATVVSAKADAEAMSLKNKAVTEKIIQLNAVQRWDGKLPATLVTGSGQMPLLNVLDRSARKSPPRK